MQDDNVLGAPTEGLGQTPTFEVPASAGLDQISGGGDAGRSRMQVLGSFGPAVNPAQFQQADTTSPTARFLAKTLARTGQAYDKQRQADDMVTGMQRAMAGEAVEDIAAEQPWYSRIFGDSDVVAGARAYTQEARVQQMLSQFEEQMPQLRQLSEADASKMYLNIVQRSMTGHAPTDAAIMASFQRAMPLVMKHRSKEHYAYLQEQASNSQSEAFVAAADRIESAAKQVRLGFISEEDFAARKAEVASIAVPALGQDLKSWQAKTLALARLSAEKFQFHALNAMEDVGVIRHLTPDQQAAYQRIREANEAQARVRQGDKYLRNITELMIATERPPEGWTANDSQLVAGNINAQYMSDTGARIPLFDSKALAAFGEKTDQAIAHIRDHNAQLMARSAAEAAKAADAAQAEAIQEAAILSAMSTGTLNILKTQKGFTEDRINEVAYKHLLKPLQDPYAAESGQFFDMIARSGAAGNTFPQLKSFIKMSADAGVIDGQPGPEFSRAVEQFRQINKRSPEAAMNYFGDELYKRFSRFTRMHPDTLGAAPAAGSTAMAAFQASFGLNSKPTAAHFSEKETTAGLSTAITQLTGRWPELLGGDATVRAMQHKQLENILKPYAEDFGGMMADPNEAWKAAANAAKRDGLQVFDGYVWQDRRNPDLRQTLQAWIDGSREPVALPSGGSQLADHVKETLDEAMTKAGAKTKLSTAIYPSEEGLNIVGYNSDGDMVTAIVKFSDMAESVRQKVLKKRASIKELTPIPASPDAIPRSKQFAPKAVLPNIPQ